MGAITSTGYTPARLRNSYQGVLEIDIGTHPQAAQDGGVLATPTTLVTRDGVVVEPCDARAE
jgi:hypothetical protein